MLVEAAQSDLRLEASRIAAKVDAIFAHCLADTGDGRDRLFQAMRHAGIGGGKHLRPLLTVAAGRLFAIDEDRAVRAGPAIEGIHSVELANSMILSCLENRPVEIPLDASVYEDRLRKLIANSTHQKKTVDVTAVDMAASFGR